LLVLIVAHHIEVWLLLASRVCVMRGRREETLGDAGQGVSVLGATIRAWRRHRGMSVTDLAVAAGFDASGRGYISKLEHGHIRRAADVRIERVARALGVSSIDLLIGVLPPLTDEVRIQGETAEEPLDIRGAVEALRRGLASETHLPANSHGFDEASSDLNTKIRGRATVNMTSSLDEDRIAQAVDTLVVRLEVLMFSQLHQILQEQLKPQVIDLLNQTLIARDAPDTSFSRSRAPTGHPPTSVRPRRDAHAKSTLGQ
jgi:transcriptional regulator with XRE-family HTH domain